MPPPSAISFPAVPARQGDAALLSLETFDRVLGTGYHRAAKRADSAAMIISTGNPRLLQFSVRRSRLCSLQFQRRPGRLESRLNTTSPCNRSPFPGAGSRFAVRPSLVSWRAPSQRFRHIRRERPSSTRRMRPSQRFRKVAITHIPGCETIPEAGLSIPLTVPI